MDGMEKNIQKQVIVRTYQPDMKVLKETARERAKTPDVKLGLYGQAGEVLVVINAQAYAQAAATELTEDVAIAFEDALGASVYGRGKGSLAYVTAGELIENECVIAAADAETGRILGAEFSATKRGAKVFDFGEQSYDNKKVSAKIQKELDKYIDPDEAADPLQDVSIFATAAGKCARTQFGAAIQGLGDEQEPAYAAVSFEGMVYIASIEPGKEQEKAAALAVLDMTRLLLLEEPLPYARMFREGHVVDWEHPETKRHKSGGGKSRVVPIIVLIVLLAVLGVTMWYLYQTFIKGDKSPFGSTQSQSSASDVVTSTADVPVSEAASQQVESMPQQAPASETATSEMSGAVVAPEEQQAEDTTTQAQGTGNTGTVHPFA